MSVTAPTLFDDARFVEDLKCCIDGARRSAARAVNRELMALYRDIGQAVREQRTRWKWGDAAIDRLARDLKASFPGTSCFSAARLWCMRQFDETCAAPKFLSRLVRVSERDAGRTRRPKALTAFDSGRFDRPNPRPSPAEAGADMPASEKETGSAPDVIRVDGAKA